MQTESQQRVRIPVHPNPRSIITTFDGTYYWTPDHTAWWNGTQWVPIVPPRKKGHGLRTLIIVGGVLLLIGGTINVINSAYPSSGTDISNAKIASSTEIDFTYYASVTCNKLGFTYQFYDGSGNPVGFKGSVDNTNQSVVGGRSYSITSTSVPGDTIDPSATRFVATAKCND